MNSNNNNTTPATFICHHCGETHPIESVVYFDGYPYCQQCFDENTSVCRRCGVRIWNDDNAGTDDTPLCQRCYDRYYTNCEECGRLFFLDDVYYLHDDGEPLCQSCYERLSNDRVIEDYYFKPMPNFYGDGPRYFGVELEIDNGGENDNKAREVMDIANEDEQERAYCKHDGSLSHGFEIVTHPMSLKYHMEEFPWESILEEAKYLGYLSHQAGTCGLHVHVSRDALGENRDAQDAVIARILYFVEKHWDELLKFSRRTARQLNRWAARYGYKDQPKELLEHVKDGNHAGRYTCINLENFETIEFRMFRGTLKLNTLFATLQMVNRICDVALSMSDEEMRGLSWTTFVSECQEKELIQYLKERRLYINEPVISEEDA